MATADFTIKSGDTVPVLTDTLTYSDGTVPTLAGATLKFVMRSLQSTAPVSLTGTATITNASTGAVQYVFTAADTAVAGDYQASWIVTFANSSVMTFPTVGYMSITIEDSLTSAAQQLVSIADAKEYLNIPSTDRVQDAKLSRFISAVTAVVESRVGPVVPRTFDEWHEGGQYWIRLRRRPSFAVGMNPLLQILGCEEYRGPTKYPLAIVQDPTSATTYSCMLDARMGTVYRRTTGGGVIPFAAGPWGGGMPDAVHVVYQAGQSPVPPSVYEGTLEIIRENFHKTQQAERRRPAQAPDETMATIGGFRIPALAEVWLQPARRHPALG